MKEIEINIIGFIGLGVMGGSMCKNLLKNNQWEILINDLNPEKEKTLDFIISKFLAFPLQSHILNFL